MFFKYLKFYINISFFESCIVRTENEVVTCVMLGEPGVERIFRYSKFFLLLI
jgi:hypothetical protein